jgi:hypothetical protein
MTDAKKLMHENEDLSSSTEFSKTDVITKNTEACYKKGAVNTPDKSRCDHASDACSINKRAL